MAVRRLAGRSFRGSTLIANPRRKNARKYGPSTKKGGKRKTARRAYMGLSHNARKGYGKLGDHTVVLHSKRPIRRKRKNPRKNPLGPTYAGIPVVEMAIGSLGALVVINTAKNIGFVKEQLNKIENAQVRAALPSLIGAAASYAVYTYSKNKDAKEIAKYAFIGSVFKLIDDVTDTYFNTTFKDMFKQGPAAAPSTATGGWRRNTGSFIDVETGQGINGAYVDTDTGGMYIEPTVGGSMFGLS